MQSKRNPLCKKKGNQSIKKKRPGLSVYEGIIKEIKEQVHPGTLVLIRAGPFGKIYANEVRKQGGMGLDVGSMFNAWAKNRNVQIYEKQELFFS